MAGAEVRDGFGVHLIRRSEDALQQRRHIKIGIKLGPVQAQPRRADLDFGELRCRRASEPLGQMDREAETGAVVESEADRAAAPVEARSNDMATTTVLFYLFGRCSHLREARPFACDQRLGFPL